MERVRREEAARESEEKERLAAERAREDRLRDREERMFLRQAAARISREDEERRRDGATDPLEGEEEDDMIVCEPRAHEPRVSDLAPRGVGRKISLRKVKESPVKKDSKTDWTVRTSLLVGFSVGTWAYFHLIVSYGVRYATIRPLVHWNMVRSLVVRHAAR